MCKLKDTTFVTNPVHTIKLSYSVVQMEEAHSFGDVYQIELDESTPKKKIMRMGSSRSKS